MVTPYGTIFETAAGRLRQGSYTGYKRNREPAYDDPKKAIKTRGSFPNDEAATKLLFLAIHNVGIHWRRRVEWTAVVPSRLP